LGMGAFQHLLSLLGQLLPLPEIRCPRTIPSVTMKWHFSQLSTRCWSSHRYKTLLRLNKQLSRKYHAHKNHSYRLRLSFQYNQQIYIHASLKSSMSIKNWMAFSYKQIYRMGSKSGLFLIIFMNRNLWETWITI
jgi:hypothetical protein